MDKIFVYVCKNKLCDVFSSLCKNTKCIKMYNNNNKNMDITADWKKIMLLPLIQEYHSYFIKI